MHAPWNTPSVSGCIWEVRNCIIACDLKKKRQHPTLVRACPPARKYQVAGAADPAQASHPQGCRQPCTTQANERSLSNGWALCPAFSPKVFSSRTTRYIRCRPSPSPTVNVFNTSASQNRARLNGSSQLPAPTHTRTHTHAHPHTRAQARTRPRTRTRTRPSTRTRTRARTRTRTRTQTHHAHAHAHAHAAAPAPAHAPGTTHLDNLRRQHVPSWTGSKAPSRKTSGAVVGLKPFWLKLKLKLK